MLINDARAEHDGRLDLLASRPRRNPVLHWAAFVLSLVSFALLVAWMAAGSRSVPSLWAGIDVGLGAAFAVEFFTRSGFRWKHIGYVGTHFFDFAAIVPALVLVNRGYSLEALWVWLILIARAARVADRLFGDGFVQRNVFALIEGFEEEITHRVLLHIATRLQAAVARGHFGGVIAAALERNKASVLTRVKAEHPREGVIVHVAQALGLDEALERAEERTYSAVISVIGSREFDQSISDALDAVFINLREQMEVRTWRQHLGFRGPHRPADGPHRPADDDRRKASRLETP